MIRIGFVAAVTCWIEILVVGNALMGGPSQIENSVKVAFAAVNPTPTLHEPIFLNLLIQNGFRENIQLDLGHNRKSNLEFTITQPDGTVVQAPRLSEEGLGRVGRLTLGLGKSYTQRVLLNEWYQFPQPGAYKLKAVLVTPIRTESGLVVNTEKSTTLDLEVLPVNLEKLSRVCQKLAATAINLSNTTEAIDASLALSYVPDPVAVQYLREILEKASVEPKRYAAYGLGRISNRDAIETLIAALNTPDSDLSSVVRAVLSAAKTRVDDPELRSKMEKALKGPK